MWSTWSVELVADAPRSDGVSGAERSVRVRIEPGELSFEELAVQIMHGPLQSDGSFDEARTVAIDLVATDDAGVFAGRPSAASEAGR